MEILKSASKIVFLMMTAGLIGLTFMGMMEVNDYQTFCLMVFTYYFTNKGTQKDNYLNK